MKAKNFTVGSFGSGGWVSKSFLSVSTILLASSPRISNPLENNFSVPCPEIMGTHVSLFFGSVNIHGNPFLIFIKIEFQCILLLSFI